MSKHTPTPWAIGKMPSVYDCHQRGDFVTINSDDWFRAKACVNAFHSPDREIATEQITVGLFWEMRSSLYRLFNACMRADAIGELHEFVDGEMLDEANAILAKLEPQK